MRPILRALRIRLTKKKRLTRTPIIFDFVRHTVHRAPASTPTGDLLGEVKKSSTEKRVVKTVEGIPPHVLQPQK
jgi:hypothetical protein